MCRLFQSDVKKCLWESCLKTGCYKPSKNFNEKNSLALELNGEPIILFGYEGNKTSDNTIDRLLLDSNFKNLIEHYYGEIKTLEKIVVSNKKVCKQGSYDVVVKAIKKSIDESVGAVATTHTVKAIILDKKSKLAVRMCITNSIMQCFYPEAKPLSMQLKIEERDLNKSP